MGSAYEVEYHALLAKDLGFISEDSYDLLATRIIEVKRCSPPSCEGTGRTLETKCIPTYRNLKVNNSEQQL
jgi:hypothetical protein